MTLSKPFTTQLKALRSVLNERVETTRRSPTGLDTEAFSEFLAYGVDPIVRSLASNSPDRLPIVVDELFTMALSVVSTGHAGPAARHDYVNRLWGDVAPSLSALIAYDTVESLGALTNAMIKVAGNRHINSEYWLSFIGHIAPEAKDIAALKSLCIIAAWRSGGAALRGAALEAADALPQNLACKVVGAPNTAKWDAVHDRLCRDMWWRPDGVESSGHVIGGFAGFQGSFLEPPIVKPAEEGFWVQSGELYFHLTVDGFGANLHAIDIEDEVAEFDTVKAATPTKMKANQAWTKLFPSEGLNLVSNANSVAATSPHSYSIHVSPLLGAA